MSILKIPTTSTFEKHSSETLGWHRIARREVSGILRRAPDV